MKKTIFFVLIILSLSGSICRAQQIRQVSLAEFINLAVQKDTEFEQILIDEYKLSYTPALTLDAQDIIMSIKNGHAFNLKTDEHDADVAVSLSRLFRKTGTTISTTYASDAETDDSRAGLQLSQDIARNAFGRAGRLKEKLAGIDVDIARFQIVEAYEDYLAGLIMMYYNWYESFAKLNTAKTSYEENSKLLENIKDRRKSKIALDIDVNKISVQVLGKKESLIDLSAEYEAYCNDIKRVVGYDQTMMIEPVTPEQYLQDIQEFKTEYKSFSADSRTIRTLSLLEKQKTIQRDLEADILLPSIKLSLGLEAEGDGYGIENTEKKATAGVNLSWPLFGGQKERAAYEIAKVEAEKEQLNSLNVNKRLLADLKNLSKQIQKEKQLIDIAVEKISLAESIVRDETENYSYGKATLNDLIQEVNSLEDQRFSKILHSLKLQKLLVEWRRITDTLVSEQKTEKGFYFKGRNVL
ncbi:MAG: TolC family protein [Candidatus Omnitrophota bacterium]